MRLLQHVLLISVAHTLNRLQTEHGALDLPRWTDIKMA